MEEGLLLKADNCQPLKKKQRIRVSGGSEFVMFRLTKPTPVNEIKDRIDAYFLNSRGKVKPYYLDGCGDDGIVALGTDIYVFNK